MPSAPADPDIRGFPNAATPVGSPVYYAVRFSPAGVRDALALLVTWNAEVRSISDEPRDPGVARLKLDWWRQELARLRDGEARHPIAAGLQQLPGFEPRCVDPLYSIIDATEEEIRRLTITSEQAFVEAAQHTGGALFEALVMQENLAIERDSARRQGTYCEIVDRIRLVRQHPQRLPVNIAPGVEDQPDSAQFALRCTQILDRVADDLPSRSPGGSLSVTDRLVALHRALHDKMQRLHYPVDRPAIDRAPIANLWTAWRCR
jgi:phytoene synthase